ncbi:peptidogalycan biosysnthesis protein [Streptomyces sp. NPDC050704]|uniref:peptidogalycan biosysnthesis protein n=1 Tax=Streptomyces sp. NPDC050704 TaxID=3157219 RepID=UPI00343D1E57
MTVQLHSGLAHVAPGDWQALNSAGRVDRSHAYLGFREHVEPGDAVVATLDDERGLLAAVHGAMSRSDSALFSHPWKMLTSEQFLRADDDSLERVRAEHSALVDAIAGPGDASEQASRLAAVLGEALVIRGFDNSEVIFRQDLSGQQRSESALRLVEYLQDRVREGLAGALVFPFVSAGNSELTDVLVRLGFQRATLTAVTFFDVSGFRSYDAFLAALPARYRRRYRIEEQAMDRSHLHMATTPLRDSFSRIVELEALNAEKYGGKPDRGRLGRTRREMAERLDTAIRIPVAVSDDAEIVACGIHLVDENSYCNLVYGCDYAVEERATAYQWINFYDPLRYATSRGIKRVRLGFEAFSAKLQRGARLDPRETWLWVPDPGRQVALEGLVKFLDERGSGYFEQFTVKR